MPQQHHYNLPVTAQSRERRSAAALSLAVEAPRGTGRFLEVPHE